MTLKDIFKIIEGREWDNFGWDEKHLVRTEEFCIWLGTFEYSIGPYHLAQLLANQSWCKAVWGEELERDLVLEYLSDDPLATTSIGAKVPSRWGHYSVLAFRILQRKTTKEVINYIHKTMKK